MDVTAGVGDPEALARTLVLRKLATAPRSRHQLLQHLLERGIPVEVADEVLARFSEVGYVDDPTFAQDWVQGRHRVRALSRRVLRQELRDRGIADDIAEHALSQISQDAEVARAREFAERRAARLSCLEPEVALRRLAGTLQRKGYHWSVALSVAQEALGISGADRDRARHRDGCARGCD